MYNMFSNLERKTKPKNLHSCMAPDPVSDRLIKWAEGTENVAFYGSAILAVLVIIFAFIGAIITEDFIMLFISLLVGPILGIIFYLVLNTYALLIGALASLVYNTNVSTNVALYQADDDKTINSAASSQSISNNLSFETKPVEKWVCPKCGTNNPKSKMYCINCGNAKSEQKAPKKTTTPDKENSTTELSKKCVCGERFIGKTCPNCGREY